MMLPEEENGLLLNEQQIQHLREARNKTRLPKSLSALAIRSVTTHLDHFVGESDSPLKYLPNTIAQQFLSKIATNIKKGKTLLFLEEVLGLLMNPNVTEFDCTAFQGPFFEDKTLSNYLIEHALKNCPKIRKINFPHELKFDESLKKSWKNLTTIICSKWDIYTAEHIMAFLQENFPTIEELAVRIRITDGPTAQTMLDHFIKWKRLHTLTLLDVAYDSSLNDSVIPEFIADVAGAVPSLQNFSYSYVGMNANKFIDLFGEKYPHKKLCVDKLRILEGLKKKWPNNLSVKHLTFNFYGHCMMSDTEIENLSTLKCTLDLAVVYHSQSEQQIYKVLDCIGGLVKSLTINSSGSSDILERILAACPNLEHFKFIIPREVIEDPNYNMSPAAFNKYKSFEIVVYEEYSSQVVLQQVFRKFLIGTKVCESLKLYHYDQLEAVAQVALAYPESLQKLRELHFIPFNRVFRSYSRDRMNEVLLKYDKSCYELLTCCHKLERIFSYVEKGIKLKQWKQENRYDLTIKAIDPHFIKYY